MWLSAIFHSGHLSVPGNAQMPDLTQVKGLCGKKKNQQPFLEILWSLETWETSKAWLVLLIVLNSPTSSQSLENANLSGKRRAQIHVQFFKFWKHLSNLENRARSHKISQELLKCIPCNLSVLKRQRTPCLQWKVDWVLLKLDASLTPVVLRGWEPKCA